MNYSLTKTTYLMVKSHLMKHHLHTILSPQRARLHPQRTQMRNISQSSWKVWKRNKHFTEYNSRTANQEDTGIDRFSIDLSAGNRTSSSLHAFSIPTQRPRIIEIPANTPNSTSPAYRQEDLVARSEPNQGVLNIVLMLVGCRGGSLPTNANCPSYC